MKLVTFQHPKVVEILDENKIYYPNPDGNSNEYTDIFYQYSKKFGKTIKSAVWAIYRVDGIRCDKLDNIIIGKILSTMPFLEYNVPMLIDVPDNIVMLSDFYSWSSYIQDLNDGLEDIEPINWDKEINWDEIVTVQAIFPYLKLKWVDSIGFGNRLLMEWEE